MPITHNPSIFLESLMNKSILCAFTLLVGNNSVRSLAEIPEQLARSPQEHYRLMHDGARRFIMAEQAQNIRSQYDAQGKSPDEMEKDRTTLTSDIARLASIIEDCKAPGHLEIPACENMNLYLTIEILKVIRDHIDTRLQVPPAG